MTNGIDMHAFHIDVKENENVHTHTGSRSLKKVISNGAHITGDRDTVTY